MAKWEKGYRDKETGDFIKINESGGGGGGCIGCLLWPFKALFFICFVVPIKWPFYTFPRFLKRKCKPLFVLYILLWIALFAFSIAVSINPSLMGSVMEMMPKPR
jgi:hypothetical protein